MPRSTGPWPGSRPRGRRGARAREALLGRDAVSHNHLTFLRDATLASALDGDAGATRRYGQALAAWGGDEPPPWTEAHAGAAEALARALAGEAGGLPEAPDRLDRYAYWGTTQALRGRFARA